MEKSKSILIVTLIFKNVRTGTYLGPVSMVHVYLHDSSVTHHLPSLPCSVTICLARHSPSCSSIDMSKPRKTPGVGSRDGS